MKRSCYVGGVSEAHLDQEVTLMGWVHRRRDHGGVIFIDLRDREGLAQVTVGMHVRFTPISLDDYHARRL